jgi:hypothetical protein
VLDALGEYNRLKDIQRLPDFSSTDEETGKTSTMKIFSADKEIKQLQEEARQRKLPYSMPSSATPQAQGDEATASGRWRGGVSKVAHYGRATIQTFRKYGGRCRQTTDGETQAVQPTPSGRIYSAAGKDGHKHGQ